MQPNHNSTSNIKSSQKPIKNRYVNPPRSTMSRSTRPTGRLWSFYFETFRISCGDLVEQVETLRNGIGAIWKFGKFWAGPPNSDSLPIWFYNHSNVQHCLLWGKKTLNNEFTWQPTRPSGQSEFLVAKSIQWQLRHGNIGRSDSVKEDEKYSEHYHYQCTEYREWGIGEGGWKKNKWCYNQVQESKDAKANKKMRRETCIEL